MLGIQDFKKSNNSLETLKFSKKYGSSPFDRPEALDLYHPPSRHIVSKLEQRSYYLLLYVQYSI